jgi:hypothetical protein
MQPSVNSSTDITQNSFNGFPVNLSWRRQKLANFVYGEGKIWTGECKVLQASDSAAILKNPILIKQSANFPGKLLY